jgi:hypothetical protein
VYKGTINTQKSKDAFKISQHHSSPIKYHDSNLRFSNHVFLLTGVEVQQYNFKIAHIAIKFDKKIIISIEKASIVKTNNLKRIELKEDINKVTLILALTTKMLQMKHKPLFSYCGSPLLEISTSLAFIESNLSRGWCTTGIGVGLSSIVFNYCHFLASVSLLSLLIFYSHLKYLHFTSHKVKLDTRPKVECNSLKHATSTNL